MYIRYSILYNVYKIHYTVCTNELDYYSTLLPFRSTILLLPM